MGSASPSTSTSPAASGCSPSSARASVDLPHPDSPTRATIWPGMSVRFTPSTARAEVWRPVWKLTCRSRASRAGDVMRHLGALPPDRRPTGGGRPPSDPPPPQRARGCRVSAVLARAGTAWRERAPVAHVAGEWGVTGQPGGRVAEARVADPREGPGQGARVGVRRALEHVGAGTGLHDPPRVHDRERAGRRRPAPRGRGRSAQGSGRARRPDRSAPSAPGPGPSRPGRWWARRPRSARGRQARAIAIITR